MTDRKPDGSRLLFFDGSAGASGDMILGALIDAGVPFAPLRRALQSLPVEGWTIRSRRLIRCGLAARKIDVRVREQQPGRGLAAIRRVIAGAGLPPSVRRRSLEIFGRLIDAEAQVHGADPKKVHLHEAGGVDAIVDVVGACLALEQLAPDRIVVGPLTTGHGSVTCAHGRYPLPAPATQQLLLGVPAQAGDLAVERLTPTGAAILTTIADEWAAMPPICAERVGYGAGSRDLGDDPNCLRVVVGRAPGPSRDRPEISVLESNLDDVDPRTLAWAIERLRAAGALDAWLTPVTMKKGRIGQQVTVLTRTGQEDALAAILLRETPTLGVRVRRERRIELDRRSETVTTRYGRIRVKVACLDGAALRGRAEDDDCVAAARRHDVPIDDVRQEAETRWRSATRVRRKTKERP